MKVDLIANCSSNLNSFQFGLENCKILRCADSQWFSQFCHSYWVKVASIVIQSDKGSSNEYERSTQHEAFCI